MVALKSTINKTVKKNLLESSHSEMKGEKDRLSEPKTRCGTETAGWGQKQNGNRKHWESEIHTTLHITGTDRGGEACSKGIKMKEGCMEGSEERKEEKG